jgi:hypothetical protein
MTTCSFAACLTLALVGRLSSYVNVVNAADGGEPQFEDNFETLDPSWGDAESIGVENGKFYIELPADYWRTALNQSNVFTDIDATVTVTFVKLDDPQKGLAGLSFWAADYDSYYDFSIDMDGRYLVSRRAKNRWLTVIDWKQHDAIKKGLGEANELRVVTNEHTVTLYVNGVQLTTFKGQPPAGGGMIGFNADNFSKQPARFEFARLKVM